MTQGEISLKADLNGIIRRYGDAVETESEGAYSLTDFVTFIISEEMDDSDRKEIQAALEAIAIING